MTKKFIDSIVEKENAFYQDLEKCRKNGYPTYIFGGGLGGRQVELRTPDYHFDGKVANRKYFQEGKDDYCLEDILEETEEPINLVVAFRGFHSSQLDAYRDRIAILADYDCYASNYECDPEFTTYAWVCQHEQELQGVYESLEDELSRKSLSAYLNQKVSLKYGYLESVKTQPQYFVEDIMPLADNEVFVDCGAFDGDSALAFIDELNRRGISGYEKIISFEPDPYNYEKLVARKFQKHQCIKAGTGEQKGVLHFSISGTSSVISNEGDIEVKIEAIDDVVNDKVTLIKMDIEGAELASLKGAAKTIQRDKPKCAICIYHKKQDLWEIQNYLKSLVPEYKFYIRAHERTATELVLYAIV